MLRMQFDDYLDSPAGFDADDPYRQLTEHLDVMDIPDNLGLENPGLMSSEFFDSVLSLEEQTCNFENYTNCDIPSPKLEDNFIHMETQEDLRLNNNGSPDSGTSSFEDDAVDFKTLANNNNTESEKPASVLIIKKPQQNVTKIGPSIQVPAKIILNNPNGKKVIVTKPFGKNNRRISSAKHIYKVQSISGNGKSLLLPFNVANLKNVKIINGKTLTAEDVHITKSKNVPLIKFEDNYNISSPDTVDDDSDSFDVKSHSHYPVLVLTEEEKRLLTKEGVNLPTHYPLTKNQEKELKRIRRKIRNKISAQDSRKRKKEYLDGLEERLKQSAEEKKALIGRIKFLQTQNTKLMSQMHRLQSLVFNTNKVTPTTCLLIVLMSALLVSLPNLNISKGKGVNDEQQAIARRTLLSSQRATNEDTRSLDEFLLFNRNQKPKITLDEEAVGDETDAPTYFHYDDVCEENHKNAFVDNGIIAKDIRGTLNKMKDFFKYQFDFGNSYDGKIVEKYDVSTHFPKRVRLCSDDYDDYIPAKISKLDENYNSEEFIDGELNSPIDSPTVALHLTKQE